MNLLLFATSKYLPLTIIRCLHGKNVKIYVLYSEQASFIRFSRHCKGYLSCETKNMLTPSKEFLEKINFFCKKKEIDVIIPCDIESTFFLSKTKDKITNAKIFPISNFNTLKRLNNKWEFINFLKSNEFSHPKSFLLRNSGDLNKMELDFPIIIKPLEMHSGIGVRKIESLNKAYEYLLQKNKFNSFPLLAQEFINGYQIDVSFLAKNGKIIAWTIQKSEPNGNLLFVSNLDILKMINIMAKKINYSGIAHIDMIYDSNDKSIKILEFNPRFWGSIFGSKEAGINFPYIGSLVSLNEPIDQDLKYTKLSFIPMERGILRILKINFKISELRKILNSELREIITDPLPYLYSFITNRINTSNNKNNY